MIKREKSIKIIGYFFCLLYGTLLIQLLINPWGLPITAFFYHPAAVVVLFAALFLCSINIILLREWGRKLFAIINAVLALYFLVFFFISREAHLMMFFLFNGATALFFTQEKIMFVFKRGWQENRWSILVVDDDEGILKTLQNILLPRGYSVLTATSGEKGMQIAKRQKPDLIILDVILPGIKGREVCAALKEDETTKSIPVIFLTAKDSPDDIDAEMTAGGAAHITKPVNAKILLTEVKRILGMARHA